ncbi:MAG: DUF3100 domain-containing protein [Peptococcaceae bacterium]
MRTVSLPLFCCFDGRYGTLIGPTRPYALAMAAGVGSVSMMTAAVGSLRVIFLIWQK